MYKTGDRIIVHTCPRHNFELGWIGTVSKRPHHSVYFVYVLIEDKELECAYEIKNIRKLTKLDKALK